LARGKNASREFRASRFVLTVDRRHLILCGQIPSIIDTSTLLKSASPDEDTLANWVSSNWDGTFFSPVAVSDDLKWAVIRNRAQTPSQFAFQPGRVGAVAERIDASNFPALYGVESIAGRPVFLAANSWDGQRVMLVDSAGQILDEWQMSGRPAPDATYEKFASLPRSGPLMGYPAPLMNVQVWLRNGKQRFSINVDPTPIIEGIRNAPVSAR
jgi:hypothetical protein